VSAISQCFFGDNFSFVDDSNSEWFQTDHLDNEAKGAAMSPLWRAHYRW
jgi:hypothetical protein